MDFKHVQIVVEVPRTHREQVLDALEAAGAGRLGNYSACAFYSEGIGRFRPNDSANPYMGQRMAINEVEETRIETICERDKLREVLSAIRKAHPYEEPLLYILPLVNEDALA